MLRKCAQCGDRHPGSLARCPATGRPTGGDADLVGKTINDRYQLVRVLGDGGMGAVYKAADIVLRRFVAVKLLHEDVAEKKVSVERFAREARSAASVGHPNIIDILDFGYLKKPPVPFLVMEYVRGRSLAQLIGNEGPFDIHRACRIAAHTLAGLHSVHAQGILHRDLKPANLMLAPYLGDPEFVKVCDFGFAALLSPDERIDDNQRALTPARTLVGTPVYAAPERLRGQNEPDVRTDVYAVGVILFEMLAGRRPFDAPSFKELAKKVKKEPPRSLRTYRAEIPEELDRAVLKALAKDRENRFQDAAEFASALVPFGGRDLTHDVPLTDTFTMDLIHLRKREGSTSDGLSVVSATPTAPSAPSSTPTSASVVQGPRRSPVPPRAPRHTPPVAMSRASANLAQTTIADPSYAPGLASLRPSETDELRTHHAQAFSGRLVKSILDFVAEGYGGRALSHLLRELPEGDARIFHAGIRPTDWVPFPTVIRLVEHVDSRLAHDDLHAIALCGRAAAVPALELLRATSLSPPNGAEVLMELPDVSTKLMRGQSLIVRRSGPHHGQLELLEGGEGSLVGNVLTLGYVERCFMHFGAGDVEVTMIMSRALGDAKSVLEVTWLD